MWLINAEMYSVKCDALSHHSHSHVHVEIPESNLTNHDLVSSRSPSKTGQSEGGIPVTLLRTCRWPHVAPPTAAVTRVDL